MMQRLRAILNFIRTTRHDAFRDDRSARSMQIEILRTSGDSRDVTRVTSISRARARARARYEKFERAEVKGGGSAIADYRASVSARPPKLYIMRDASA